MNDKGISFLEDDDLFISYSGSLTKTDLPKIKQFRCFVSDYIVSYIYFIVIILKFAIFSIIK